MGGRTRAVWVEAPLGRVTLVGRAYCPDSRTIDGNRSVASGELATRRRDGRNEASHRGVGKKDCGSTPADTDGSRSKDFRPLSSVCFA